MGLTNPGVTKGASQELADFGALQAAMRAHLAGYLHHSGRVLYSAVDTLRPGPLYVLGLNPGGRPLGHAGLLGDDIAKFPSKQDNAYLDESWRSFSTGQAPLQKRLKWLVEQLGYNLRNACASNLIFLRSTDASGCQYSRSAPACWPIHELILERVQPKLILVFGNSGVSPFQFLRERYRPTSIESFESGHGSWRCLGFRAEGRAVIGLPHLSRYAVDRHPQVATWIRVYSGL